MKNYLYSIILLIFMNNSIAFAKEFNFKNIIFKEEKINSKLYIVYPETDYFTLEDTSSKEDCENIHNQIDKITNTNIFNYCISNASITGACISIYDQLNHIRYNDYPMNKDAEHIWSISPSDPLSNDEISTLKQIVASMENNIDIASVQYVENFNYGPIVRIGTSNYSFESLEQIFNELPQYQSTLKPSETIAVLPLYIRTIGKDIVCDLNENQATIKGWLQNGSLEFSGKLGASENDFKQALNIYQSKYNELSNKTLKFTTLSNLNIVKAATIGAIIGTIQNSLHPYLEDDVKNIQIKSMFNLFVNSNNLSTIYPLDTDRYSKENKVTIPSTRTMYLGLKNNDTKDLN